MKKNKGFTLVEIIVILVILAILAAVLIPSLTTYIDKAREKSVTANARGAYIAAQAYTSEIYGLNPEFEADMVSTTSKSYDEKNLDTDLMLILAQLISVKSTAADGKIETGDVDGIIDPGITVLTVDSDGNITNFSYTQTLNNKTYVAKHEDTGSWTVIKTASGS